MGKRSATDCSLYSSASSCTIEIRSLSVSENARYSSSGEQSAAAKSCFPDFEMDAKSTIKERVLERIPPFSQDPSIWVPLIVAIYVLILGLCVTGALNRQKTSIRELRREQKKIFTQNRGESDDGFPLKPTESVNGKKRGRKGVDLGDWNNIGCR